MLKSIILVSLSIPKVPDGPNIKTTYYYIASINTAFSSILLTIFYYNYSSDYIISLMGNAIVDL